MPELLTPRLRCSPLQLDDWSFFLSLQQDPQVMLYVADPRPQAAIREAFDSRLPPWTPGDEHWLCLVVRDRLTHTPLGLTGYQHHQRDIAEVGFLFAPAAQGRGYGYESLRALCDYAFTTGGVRRLTASVTAALLAIEHGAHIVRVHDVAATVDALKVLAALDAVPMPRADKPAMPRWPDED